MQFKFENLIIWQKAIEFGEDMHKLAIDFPEVEKYNLSSQLRRAADSIALNISEGSILQSDAEFRKFLGYSIRSLAEVVTCLHKSRLRNYVSVDDFNRYYSFAFNLMNMIIGFRNKIN